MTDWKPIETAEASSTVAVLLWCADVKSNFRTYKREPVGVVMGRVMEFAGTKMACGEGMNGDWQFTHWMPLPAPPVT